jgi:DNA repair exonuclease SbcCD ATPase subunit|tara:strand:- start:1633 stop:1986 length:354 start_codon:yes stop_codon:yes gene_type:complete
MSDNGNIAKNGWSEYGRLVLKELERLNEGQDKLKDEIDKKFQELNEKMSEFKNTEKDVDEIKEWKENVQEVWSATQMKQAKAEIYKQKNQWAKVTGIIIVVQIIMSLIIAFRNQIFG